MDLSELKNFDISSLDFNNVGTAPLPIRVTLIALICIAILAAGYWFDIRHQRADLEQVAKKEQELRGVFENKQRKAANLDAYKVQLEEMRRSFGSMLRQLPSKTEIPNLIIDISQTGLASGLEIELFKPRAEIRKGFYAEKPIELRVSGTYEEMANFASGVAALPRIVTIHDIALEPDKSGRDMTMTATAKTYRYLEGEGE